MPELKRYTHCNSPRLVPSARIWPIVATEAC